MSAAEKLNLISVEDYLAGELVSPIKHEYVGVVVVAMSCARNLHNLIAGNIFASLHRRLFDSRCQPFNSDTKVRARFQKRWRFFYPDAFVVCEENPATDTFQDKPVVIFEVISKKTQRTDEGEKKDVYLTIPSLSVYVLVQQTLSAVAIYRRNGEDFDREVIAGLDAVLKLPEIGIELPLQDIYHRVEFGRDEDELDHD